ncbi:MAG: DEAD/DEAH box helicase family protein, partial [Candidatus Marinimicrobia bacterium]|nr:DEAD/DEAH box helicase family protein [Candidatus Neomarinimicrobiota bacterium]
MNSLAEILNIINQDNLPPVWTAPDLVSFSKTKKLWKYQQEALRNFRIALWKYYKDCEADKLHFLKLYTDNEIDLVDLNLNDNKKNEKLLAPFYPVTDSKIPYQHFINRMGFWMATGSGKTLVIVKILEILHHLIRNKEIPAHDIMVLTHREDLIEQLREHVRDFNSSGRTPHIVLRELREYPNVKRGQSSLFGEREMTVFYYRSDNLNDVKKDKIIDFHSYDNGGQWYVLLDEAHKGDKEDSKRQHIYSILSRNGFLFNFSATFTEPRDKTTSAFVFNLENFIQSGYGKHISILKQENRAFHDKEDFTDEEKQRLVLQSLLSLVYVAKSREKLVRTTGEELFHRPLMLAIVNSVNTQDSDLKLFFTELRKIGRGLITLQAFTAAKIALKKELNSDLKFFHEDDKTFALDEELFDSLKLKDIYRYVFNSDHKGEIEVLTRPTDNKELAFRLKTSTTGSPFALIKIGETAEWLKNFLIGYEIIQGFENESFFSKINQDDSEINLLMGSRTFYEGWDSNRPNVITFINIGMGAEAQKFVLQSVGRGVRIEPVKGERQRMENLHLNHIVSDDQFDMTRPFLPAIQTLFIYGTNRDALDKIIEGLDLNKDVDESVELALEINKSALSQSHPVLIPVYRKIDGKLLIEEHEPRKFEILPDESKLLKEYREYLGDERLLLAHHEMTPKQIEMLDKVLTEPDKYLNPNTKRKFGKIDVLLPHLVQYFNLIPHEVKAFKSLEDEIKHFQHIIVKIKSLLPGIQEKIDKVKKYQDHASYVSVLKDQLNRDEINLDQYTDRVSENALKQPGEIFEHNSEKLHIKNIAKHYYLPLLHSEKDRLSFISRVIQEESEVEFVKHLDEYLNKSV